MTTTRQAILMTPADLDRAGAPAVSCNPRGARSTRHPGLAALASVALAAWGCGDNAIYGLDALVDAVPVPAGAQCPAGGVAISSGIDRNRNGVLDADEIGDTTVVCNGRDGVDGTDGDITLISVRDEPPGENCPFGGTVVSAGIDDNRNGVLDPDEVSDVEYVCRDEGGFGETLGFTLRSRYVDVGSAEIVALSADGTWLAYTSAASATVGFVDVSDAGAPRRLGEVSVADVVGNLAGQPTAVDITPNGQYAVVAVKDTTNPIANADPGALVFIDSQSRTITGQVELGVGPDSVRISPDGSFAVVAIEDEEDPDLGAQEQSRPGSVQVVTIDYAAPENSPVDTVELVPSVGQNPGDPQPEYVDISADSTTAIVSLQENNAIAVIDLTTSPATVSAYLDAGVVDRAMADVVDDGEIVFDSIAYQGRREPDGVCLLADGQHFITANEGDTQTGDFVDGQYSGGRGFSIFRVDGQVVYDVGDELELIALQYGMYPDGRSDNRGIEVEGCAVARFGNREFAFILSERNGAVAVYDVTQPENPGFVQLLPTPLRPESAQASPERGLLVVAGEGADGAGGGIWLYQGVAFAQDVDRYPQGVYRAVSSTVPPTPFGGFSAAMETGTPGRIAVIPDDSFDRLRLWIFDVDAITQRMRLTGEIQLTQPDGVTPITGRNPQGLARNPWGGFAVAVAGGEDNGCVGVVCPEAERNRILFFDDSGALDVSYGEGGAVDIASGGAANAIDWRRLPEESFGGLTMAVTGDNQLRAYVVFRRPLDSLSPADPDDEEQLGYARIGEYDVATGRWAYFYYPLRGDREDVSDGAIELTDIAHVAGDRFVVTERDAQPGAAARVKRVFSFGLSSGRPDQVGNPLRKTLVADLLDTPFRFDFERVDALAVSGDSYWLANHNGGGEQASFFYELPAPGLPQPRTARFATFNAALNRNGAGDLTAELAAGSSAQIRTIAEIIQRAAPDVILLNEFDYDPTNPALPPQLFQQNYLSVSQNGASPIQFPYVYIADTNTGLLASVDIDGDGAVGLPGDGYGFGFFHGQFGQVLFSRYPIDIGSVRTFQTFLWQDMPGALLPDDPLTPEPGDYYSPEALAEFRLSSKSHWDVPIIVDGRVIHALVSHPTPPVFDGPEDFNGRRNHDEIRFWADYVTPGAAGYIYDDAGASGGLPPGDAFVILGDLNADPNDGDSANGAVLQLLDHPMILTESPPVAIGGLEQARSSGAANDLHVGNAAHDTGDFNDAAPGNLRVDYVLPSRNLGLVQSAVFWPSTSDPLFSLIGTFPFPSSDHRLVWADLTTR